MVKARKYVVKKYFQGVPKRDDFEIVEYELPPLKEGEIVIKAEWISVDPYLRIMNSSVPYDMYGYQVATVVESKSPEYPVGVKVASHNGWCDYSIANTKPGTDKEKTYLYKLPDLKGLSPSHAIGAIGMPGISAYYGFLDILDSKPGETVVVSGAAGAVGSIVGQIAKIKGSKVIGFAGSDEKVRRLETELGFDKAINYKTAEVVKALKEAAPNGVDCYFDNVGGELSSIILSQMNKFGRITACGSISSYNDDVTKLPKATVIQQFLVFKQLTYKGFAVWNKSSDEWWQALEQLTEWAKNGQIKLIEHVTEGFDKLYDAFVGMLAGDNFGKAVVKV